MTIKEAPRFINKSVSKARIEYNNQNSLDHKYKETMKGKNVWIAPENTVPGQRGSVEARFSLSEMEEQVDTAFAKWQRLIEENAPEREVAQALEEMELILDGIGGAYGDSEEVRVRNKYAVEEVPSEFEIE